jgi:hypothetical protein
VIGERGYKCGYERMPCDRSERGALVAYMLDLLELDDYTPAVSVMAPIRDGGMCVLSTLRSIFSAKTLSLSPCAGFASRESHTRAKVPRFDRHQLACCCMIS